MGVVIFFVMTSLILLVGFILVGVSVRHWNLEKKKANFKPELPTENIQSQS